MIYYTNYVIIANIVNYVVEVIDFKLTLENFKGVAKYMLLLIGNLKQDSFRVLF